MTHCWKNFFLTFLNNSSRIESSLLVFALRKGALNSLLERLVIETTVSSFHHGCSCHLASLAFHLASMSTQVPSQAISNPAVYRALRDKAAQRR